MTTWKRLITMIRCNSLSSEAAIGKVKRLWVDDPVELAYYKLKGMKIIHGVLDIDWGGGAQWQTPRLD